MNLPKRHHYVPRFVLANFLGENDTLWVKRAHGGAAWSSLPENVYVERHRYSLVDQNGDRDPQLEQAYALLEGEAKPVIEKLLNHARDNKIPYLSAAEKAVWDEFLYHQMKRVPAMTNNLANKESWDARLESTIMELQSGGIVIDDALLTELRSPTGLKRLRHNATVKALSADGPLVRKVLNASSIEAGVAPATAAFVIGSRPIAGAAEGLQSAAQGKSAMWFPVASDVVIRPLFDESAKTTLLTEEDVAIINGASVSQSEFIAGKSKALVDLVCP